MILFDYLIRKTVFVSCLDIIITVPHRNILSPYYTMHFPNVASVMKLNAN